MRWSAAAAALRAPVMAASAIVLVFATTAVGQQQPAAPPEAVASSAGELRVERLATLESPWGMALLPDGRILITEKPGSLRVFAEGKLSEPVQGVPKAYRHGPGDQGGLMDVEVDPKFSENGLVYLSYTEPAAQQSDETADTDDYRFGRVDLTDRVVRGGAVARGRLEGNALTDVKVIWRQRPKTVGRGHFGNRIVFGPDGKLYITSGDRMRFEPAQNLGSNLGKVVRINPDGTVPDDNPMTGKEGVLGEIYSYGHRNVLSAAFDPQSKRLWVVEMGPLGGDELNLVEPGKNYGWPYVSNGSHYGRPGVPTALMAIPSHPSIKEFQQPVRSWTPVISPSGASFYTGELFPQWRGSLLVGGLSTQGLIRLTFDGDRVATEERLHLQRRVRDVMQAPDGAILLLIDAPKGDLLRLTPGGK